MVNILIGMIRTKFVAALIGPAGVGLVNVYNTMTTPINAVVGMGIATSGVRQIAVANGKGDSVSIARTVGVLRRTVWVTGLLGLVATVALSPWLSRLTFGNCVHVVPICILGGTLLLENIKMGQGCVLQGTRRVADIAKTGVWGAVNGTLISIPCYYLWGVDGVIVSIALCSIAALAVSWFYARRVKVQKVELPWPVIKSEVRGLISLGFPLMLTALMSSGVNYAMRLIVLKNFQLDGVGIWGAAFYISSILVSFVLSAMGTDYFPRLTSVANDDRRIAEEVNVQAEVALLLAAPGIAATLLFAPLGIHILYTEKFYAAIPILRWSVLGMLAKVLSWPFGYIVLAKGKGKLFLGLEVLANVMSLLFMVIGCKFGGLTGTGMATAACNGVYLVIIMAVSWTIARTFWTWHVLRLVMAVCGVTFVCALLHRLPIGFWSLHVVSGLILAALTFVCLKTLTVRTGIRLKLPWTK